MRTFKRVLAAVIAVVLVLSVASCSLTKEWSYKYGDKTYDIGVYIYALYSSYTTAQTYAADAKGYKENESFMDLKIKDSDGKKAVARDWCNDKADEQCRELVALDKLIKDKNVKISKSDLEAAEEVCKNAWDMGPYAAYSAQYYNPIKSQVEDYGVSFDSFKQLFVSPVGNSIYALKTEKLFDALYGKGGSEEVPDKELTEFFTKNYVDYSCVPVNLYTSETGDDGNAANKAFSSKKIKKITAAMEALADQINSGEIDFGNAGKTLEEDYSVSESDISTNKVDTLENLKSNNEDIYNALEKLETGKALVKTVGIDGDTPTAYLVVKNEVTKDTKDYIEGDNRTSVLQNMKSDDYKDYLKKEAKKIKDDKKFERNDGAINGYQPDMFFKKSDESSSSSGSDSDSDSDSDSGSDSE